jgi:hypothetical protein
MPHSFTQNLSRAQTTSLPFRRDLCLPLLNPREKRSGMSQLALGGLQFSQD